MQWIRYCTSTAVALLAAAAHTRAPYTGAAVPSLDEVDVLENTFTKP